MDILVLTPTNPISVPNGNQVSLGRWNKILREAGHRVSSLETSKGLGETNPDVVVALHAKYSGKQIQRLRQKQTSAELPIVLVMTGTDLYRDIPRGSKVACRSLEICDRIVLLQEQALVDVPAPWKKKCRVIYQSCEPLGSLVKPLRSVFEITVVGHLRVEKDPLRTAYAVRALSEASRVRVTHIGGCYDPIWQDRVELEQQGNERYRWIGPLSLAKTRRHIARSQAVVITSKMEGAGNVISEAIADGVPVLASRIPGTIGMLGKNYQGFYSCGSTSELRQVIARFESEPEFREQLRQQIEKRRPLISPLREQEAWQALLAELT